MSLQPFLNKNNIEVGIDEAGRGPLIGRVYAAAVIWPKDLDNPEINDSKKISAKKRKILKKWILENVIDYGIGYAEPEEIDEINILQATYLAMHRALDNLKKNFDSILVDGNRFKPYQNINYNTIIKGDATFYSISAASILAKEYHDEYIKEICIKDPELDNKYKLLSNMGYGTKDHIKGIQEYGITQYHRKSFKTCQKN
jgi:ribonuclease HII